jgi:S-adenosylmethionine synthetase
VNVALSILNSLPVDRQPMEIVERKGLGHPDTICDALAEGLSRSLCKFYQERFGFVLHHNVDKGMLHAGSSRPIFGGGEILEPMEVYLVGRVTMSYKGVKVPAEELAVEGSRQWFRKHFHALDPERHVRFRCLLRPGSAELTELYLRQAKTGIALANDTSCGVGYAPFDDLETIVYRAEQQLNRKGVCSKHPAFGQDIKVMGVRTAGSTTLTVACAFVDRFLQNIDDYLGQRAALADQVKAIAQGLASVPVEVAVNTADDPQSGSIYLTVTGTSGEAGDDGAVGRGNRANGLITPYRPMNMEAVAGKNPITHVGKIYNIVARMIAERIVRELPDVEEAYCYMVSQIGQPIDQPQSVECKLRIPDPGVL